MNWYKRAQEEWSWKRLLTVFGATAILGLAALWHMNLLDLRKLYAQQPQKVEQALESIQQQPNQAPERIQDTPQEPQQAPEQPNSDEAILRSNFPKEYDIIKKAADRNNCIGEDLLILFAMRKSENGDPGIEFGVLHPRAKGTNLDTQAGWAAATIVKNRARWNGEGDFIDFLGSRYCPVGAENDPTGLNENWIGNVKSWVEKLKG